MAKQVEMAPPAGIEHIVIAVRKLKKDRGKLPSERDLAALLNVKRHQLRKALEYLRQNGELSAARAKRTTSALPRFGEELVRLTNPIEVIEMRLIIEPGLARLASLRASPLDIARITEAATTPPATESGKADLAFHGAISKAARNHLAVEFYKTLRQVGVDARVRVNGIQPSTCPKRVARRDAEHRLIAEAISQRDPDAAEAAMRKHLKSVLEQINEHSNANAFAA